MIKTKPLQKEKSTLEYLVSIYLNFIILGLPLIVTNGYYNITETKSVYFFILSLIFIISFIFLIIIEIVTRTHTDTAKKRFSLLDISMICFAASTLLSTLLSKYPAEAWLGRESRYQGALIILIYVAVYFIVSRNYSFSQNFVLCTLISFSVVSLIGVLNCFNIDILGFYGSLAYKYKRSYISTIGNINFYSSFICLVFPVIICGFCQTRQKSSNIIYISALIIGSFGMLVTSSESFVVGFASSLLVIPLLLFDDIEKLKKYLTCIIIMICSTQIFIIIYKNAKFRNSPLSKLIRLFAKWYVALPLLLMCIAIILLLSKKPQFLSLYKKIYKIFLILLLVSVAVCFVLSNTVGLGSLDSTFKITDDWGTSRGIIWKQCIEIYKNFSFKEKLFGLGPETVRNVIKTPEVFSGRTVDQAHNEYLQLLLTVGALGFLSYLFIIVSTTITVVKKLKSNPFAIGLFAGIVAYWVQATVNIAQPFSTPIMYIFIACIGGMLFNKNKTDAEDPPEKVFNINQNSRRKFNGTQI